ncbi:MAG: prepilin peptidase [Patescibacteria group bacterium]
MFLVSIFVFLFGLTVGSFLNAVIYRLSQGDSAMKGRSYCPQCKHTLAWYDLVPVVSFVLLGGKCRYCKKPISWQYPIVEMATAVLFLLILESRVSSLNQVSSIEVFKLFYLWIIAAFLVVLFAYDLRHYILPDKMLFPAIGIVLVYRVFEVLNLNNWSLFGPPAGGFEFRIFDPLISGIVSGVLAAGFFLTIFLASRGRAMGFGDVKLAFFMGLFLGWPNILVALFVAFFAGAIIGVGLIALQKKQFKSEIPFGPFLIPGTFVAFFWGNEVVQWYLNLSNL